MKKNINNTYKFGASLIALAFSLSASTNVQAQTCTTVPTCDELGYTRSAAECATASLKCPFDKTKYYCLTADELGKLEGKGNCDNPNVGSILYSDMSCSTDLIYGKTPIGVIFNTEKRLAIALKTAKAVWSIEFFDFPNLTNYTMGDNALNDWNGKANTLTVTSYCTSRGKTCPAFDYIKNYSTTGTYTGDWYLPALGELRAIYDNRDVLNTTLSKIGGTTLPNNHHWSSSEVKETHAWHHNFNDEGGSGSGSKTGDMNYVRPVLQF